MNTAFVRALCNKMSAAASWNIQRFAHVSRSSLTSWAPRPGNNVIRNMQTASWAHEPLQYPQLLRGSVTEYSLQWQTISQCSPCTALRLSSSQPEAQQQPQPSSVVDRLRKPCQRGTSLDEARRLHSLEEWQACCAQNPLPSTLEHACKAWANRGSASPRLGRQCHGSGIHSLLEGTERLKLLGRSLCSSRMAAWRRPPRPLRAWAWRPGDSPAGRPPVWSKMCPRWPSRAEHHGRCSAKAPSQKMAWHWAAPRKAAATSSLFARRPGAVRIPRAQVAGSMMSFASWNNSGQSLKRLQCVHTSMCLCPSVSAGARPGLRGVPAGACVFQGRVPVRAAAGGAVQPARDNRAAGGRHPGQDGDRPGAHPPERRLPLPRPVRPQHAIALP